MRLTSRIAGLVCAIGLASSGCSDDPLSVGDLVATWEATTFQLAPTGGAVVDVLAGGGSLTITIAANGSTTGAIFVPAALNGGTAFSESMAGTIDLNGNSISFDQAADSFVRDATWTVNGSTISGTHTDGSGTITVVLARQ